MNITYNKKIDLDKCEGVILPLFEDENNDYKEYFYINEYVKLDVLKTEEIFTGKKGEVFQFIRMHGSQAKHFTLLGFGEKAKVDNDMIRRNIAKGIKSIKSKKVESIAIYLEPISEKIEDKMQMGVTIGESIIMANYTFDKYLSKDDNKEIADIELIINDDVELKQGIQEGVLLGNTNIFARDLVNDPANVLTPEVLAKIATEEGIGRFEVEVLSLEQIKALKMEAYLSVGQGSAKEPKFIVMRYENNPGGETLGFIGKGLTYDAGGLSIKPTNSMTEMKSDMGGAAAVIGALTAIADAKVKINITAIVAACENMISGDSYKPGDIIGSMAGKSIFIGNTDAEGRLTLVDAIHYGIEKEGITKVVDIATLTGAALHCLGVDITPVLTNDEAFYKHLENASKICDEKIWQLPIIDEYKELLKHDHADLTNTPGAPGTITAGLFIKEFVQDLPWLHLDIAGTSFAKKNKHYISKGATGEGARLLYHLAKELENNK